MMKAPSPAEVAIIILTAIMACHPHRTITTTTAAVQMITHRYWPANANAFVISMNIGLIALILGCSYTILVSAGRRVILREPTGDRKISSL
jgi:hypothetical protein